ncbi:exportin-1 [Sphaeroforma arctica JP610]|uniref:Exportin-1 n=1 Tax=Sphaeroforma arctica JP610 TaxID=667725 RepID=A0A0L0G155_9EUKA|nr:exportin-1 [Sphaeroforma arctica JP610]KNC82546.1 exportin-1 [Sphaeroforma arctica JP610]|eukprot:XP_014156448.1 exportin-1 [Sphaeroforma arctica JP610]
MAAMDPASLLDFTQELNVQLLDSVVNAMNNPLTPQQQEIANQVLTQLKDTPDAWTRVDKILDQSQNPSTRFYALSILESTIATKWNVLPTDQREAVKEFIVSMIIRMSSEPQQGTDRVFIRKLNMILVQIVKQEWPHAWPSFIPDIVGSSKTSESLCENNMAILKLLSEEVFEYSSGKMTVAKARALKDSMNSQFSMIFELCMFVFENTDGVSLIKSTLETLLCFLSWIPIGYIYETQLIDILTMKYLGAESFRNLTIMCLTEIASIKTSSSPGEGGFSEQIVKMFTQTMKQLTIILPSSINIKEAYNDSSDFHQQFIRALALFLTSYLKTHRKLLESKTDNIEVRQLLLDAHYYLVLISEVEDTEIFKICLEYWHSLTDGLYNESPYTVSTMYSNSYSSFNTPQPTSPRRELYKDILTLVRKVMITHMVKPEEVLIVETDSGEIVREFMPTHTDTLNQYKTMRQVLVFLTHLDCSDTKSIMIEKLHRQVDGSEWSWKSVNTLCWAIGSISGAMSEDDEKGFLVTVIKHLLGLVEQKKGKDNKAVVASNIMYIVGQYPRFLRAHWKFLKTVVFKLFEFMHETHEGVQDMACDTYIKIAQKCSTHFVHKQTGEEVAFVDEIMDQMHTIIHDLTPQQVNTFYEACGYMIAAQSDVTERERLLTKLMHLPNESWDRIINMLTVNINHLQEKQTLKELTYILKINSAVCKPVGHPFIVQLARNYMDMLKVYQAYSDIISAEIQTNGEAGMRSQQIKSMRAVKKEVLRLMNAWVTKSNDNELVMNNLLPPFLLAVLTDYRNNVPQAREPEVLSAMCAIINKLEQNIIPQVPAIFEALFGCTLEMINKDMSEYPEHRANFFELLKAINQFAFPALLAISPDQFKLVIDSIIWSFKHTMRNVASTGLNILHMLLNNISHADEAQGFYRLYYTLLLDHVLAVMTDSSHQSEFEDLAANLAFMITLVENNKVTINLFEANNQSGAVVNNSQFVRQHIRELLTGAFPNLTANSIENTVATLFSTYMDPHLFSQTLQDFLVNLKVWGECEREQQLEKESARIQLEEKQKAIAVIPGMTKPADMMD